MVEEGAVVLKTADPILASDHRLRIVLWNEGVQALLGFSADEVLGKPCCELMGCRSPGQGLLYRCNCTDLLRRDRQEPLPTFDRQISRKDGERVWVHVTTLVTVSPTGLSVLVHLLRDLTRQKEIEELLRQVASSAARLSCDRAGHPGLREPAALSSSGVTDREREVIRLLAQGASTEGIAAKLSITHRTARNHIQNILSKLGVHSRLEAVAYASNRGLL
jgi:PAS domain S-box-containing protein